MFEELLGGGITRGEVREMGMSQAAGTLALVILLIERGIITEDDYQRARIRATSEVEQAAAAVSEDRRRAYDEEHPGVREMMARFLGRDPAG